MQASSTPAKIPEAKSSPTKPGAKKPPTKPEAKKPPTKPEAPTKPVNAFTAPKTSSQHLLVPNYKGTAFLIAGTLQQPPVQLPSKGLLPGKGGPLSGKGNSVVSAKSPLPTKGGPQQQSIIPPKAPFSSTKESSRQLIPIGKGLLAMRQHNQSVYSSDDEDSSSEESESDSLDGILSV